jgi:N-methylhydantoinase A
MTDHQASFGEAPVVCGIDIGGTFTDCVVHIGSQMIATKADSTRDAPAAGVLDAIGRAAESAGVGLSELLRSTREIVLGSTIGINMLVEEKTARTGFLTTRGFEDTLVIMRGGLGRVAGKRLDELYDQRSLRQPTPLVPRSDTFGVTERVDRNGNVVVSLAGDEVRAVAEEIANKGLDALAICFLWSSKNPAHERAAAGIVREVAPGVDVSCSYEVSARVGEYERAVATALNASLMPGNRRLTEVIEGLLRDQGFRGELLFLNCSGGVLPRDVAQKLPILLVHSGPAAGVAASGRLARAIAQKDAVICDMGGTSFDVGLVTAGAPLLAGEDVVGGHSFFQPRIDLTSIGAGGGSIAWLDPLGGFRVGPISADASPGPACYGRGGLQPTVTDANLVLGYLAPEDFGRHGHNLDVAASEKALASVGEAFGWSVIETAAATVRVVEAQSAELMRQRTIAQGLDPRRLTAFIQGGAGPIHAGRLGELLGVREVRIPLAPPASVWSAGAAASADVVRVLSEPFYARSPWSGEELTKALTRLSRRAQGALGSYADGHYSKVELVFEATTGYNGQIHSIDLPLGTVHRVEDVDPVDPDRLLAMFYDWYDDRYGVGFAFRERFVEIRELRYTVIARRRVGGEAPTRSLTAARDADRPVWWPGASSAVDSPVYRVGQNDTGVESVQGPGIVRIDGSTVVVNPGQTLSIEGQTILLVLRSGTGPAVDAT